MPVGLLIMRFDERYGTKVLANYPEKADLSMQTLLHLYGTHQYTGEPGMISLLVGDVNVASYYTGPESNYYIILMLKVDEDADIYEAGIAQASRRILENLKDDYYIEILSAIYYRICDFPFYTQEQLLATSYIEDVKRFTINLLKQEGVFTKSELSVLLKDKRDEENIDLDVILEELVKLGLIKVASVAGMGSDLIFHINTLLIMRKPPNDVFREFGKKGYLNQLTTTYRGYIKEFFNDYTPSEEDSLRLAAILINSDVYGVLKLLRVMVATNSELEKLRQRGVGDVEKAINTLIRYNLVQSFEDEQSNKYYALISDVYVKLIFPKDIINNIITGYE